MDFPSESALDFSSEITPKSRIFPDLAKMLRTFSGKHIGIPYKHHRNLFFATGA